VQLSEEKTEEAKAKKKFVADLAEKFAVSKTKANGGESSEDYSTAKKNKANGGESSDSSDDAPLAKRLLTKVKKLCMHSELL
jgi:hypothetical protein